MTAFSTGTARVRKLGRWLRNYSELDWRDRVEVVRILVLAAVVEVLLRSLPLPRLAKLLRVELDLMSPDRGRPIESAPPEWVLRRIQLTVMVLRHTRQTCLRNSLVLARRLRQLSPTIRIGVRKVDGRLTAHAWLELDGQFYDAGALAFEPVFVPASPRE